VYAGYVPQVLERLSFRRAVWVLPAAFAVHVLEEAPGFTEWVNRYASSRFTQEDFVRNNGLGLALAVGATALVSRFPTRPVTFHYFATILTQQAFFNSLFHLGTTVAFRAYSPGLVTSLTLFLPAWYYLTRLAHREGLLSGRGAVISSLIAGCIHGAAVAQQVFFVRPF
jgi:hypothetical protein